ncbi:hypothetical protein HU200_042937 [Digitaria exilis]|uniref:Protein kinase domain-containing protein n=1 Tax=Digitaria exilis TaxID=1010633 RepID=A0A835EFC5_9POAL|nr:hypothetical protein HU200_042937 [Digitaria exilis]
MGDADRWRALRRRRAAVEQGEEVRRRPRGGPEPRGPQPAGRRAAPDLGLLTPLQGLRSLSLADNDLAGAFPDVSPLPALRSLFLSKNRLSGEISDGAFAALRGHRKLDLSNNGFTGPIPSSIATSSKLLDVNLSNNNFSGPVPDATSGKLVDVNLANNNFSGPVPDGLQNSGAKLHVEGNKFICGTQDGPPCPSSPPPAKSSSGSMNVLITIAIVVVAIGALLAIAGIFAAIRARRNEPRYAGGTETLGGSPDAAAAKAIKITSAPAVKIEQVTNKPSGMDGGLVTPASAKRGGGGGRREDHGKLVFIQEGRARFGLEDLLRASAEVLGSGNFGASYKATLLDGPSLVVKRFKEMNSVGREDFAEHMRRLGRLVHPNLLPVVAYLYKKDEKLLVTDYMVNGSLAHVLHGGTSCHYDWPKRLKIIKGVARGLAHLYEELPMLMVPHGHLKSSNVLLDATYEPVLSDYALAPVVTPQHAAQVMVAYKSPECAAAQGGGRPGRKSDVWSLGILILEVLTGKFPANYLRQGRAGRDDLAGWVNSVVREEWTGEVFDKDMRGTRSGEGEMVKMLQVGLGCCEPDVSRRWGIEEALARIEELRERDGGGDDSSTASSFVSDGEPAMAARHGEPLSHSSA